MAAVADRLLRPKNCFFKLDGDVFAEVSATLGTSAPGPTSTPAEQVAEAEELAEDVVEILEYAGIESGASRRSAYSGVTKAVIHAALFRIGKDGISLAAFLELFFRIGIVRIAVRMKLHGQLAIGALDLLIAGAALHAQDFVIISFDVTRQSSTLSIRF